MITADTITDTQLSKLWSDLTAHESAGASVRGVRECIIALGLPDDPPTDAERHAARAICAEIINAQATGATLTCSRCGGSVHRSWDHLNIGERGEHWTCAKAVR